MYETSAAPEGPRKEPAPPNGVDPRIEIVRKAARQAFIKTNPITLFRNPVLFILEVAGAVATLLAVIDLLRRNSSMEFEALVALSFWITLLLANFCEGFTQARSKARADALRRQLGDPFAKRLCGARIENVPASKLRVGDVVLAEAGDLIPADGEVIDGIAVVDESVITGESAPVIRESGGELSAVTSGTRVVSDAMKIRVTAEPGETYLDRMLTVVETLDQERTPHEVVFNISIVALTVLFFLVSVALMPATIHATEVADVGALERIIIIFALMICLIPTSIAGLLSTIGFSGIERLMSHRVLALSRTAVERSSSIHILLLDKTGTLTVGNREAVELIPLAASAASTLAEAALLASLRDDTPEGRSTAALALTKYGSPMPVLGEEASFVPFSAYSRMSGVDLPGRTVRKGATAAVAKFVIASGGVLPPEFEAESDRIAQRGGTPLGVADGSRMLGLIHLKDVLKPGMKKRADALRALGIRSVMITGDNPVTAAAIAEEVGVDSFIAQATPADKLAFIKREQADGRTVAMTGDGSNDAPALAQADIGIAMNSGTPAAKEAANILDMDGDPTKLIEIVAAGKQIVVTRIALTLFAVTSGIATYAAVLPVVLGAAHPSFQRWNWLNLQDLDRGVLAAVLCNALAIPVLFPLARRGVQYRVLSRGMRIGNSATAYLLGGFAFPFPVIWVLDRMLRAIQVP